MKDLLYSFRSVHGCFHEWRLHRLPLVVERIKKPRAVYLVLTPEHGNLGDHAIAQSEIEILNELGVPYIEITGKRLEEFRTHRCLDIMNGRLILINGGGNLGTLWPSVETMMQCIVRQNPKSSIMILPNTFFYEDTEKGREALQLSRSVYNAHPQLKIYARERNSYEKMKAAYNNVDLVPDMVLRMNKCESGIVRKGCILCLRQDREKTISPEMEDIIREQAHLIFDGEVNVLDMVRSYPIPIENRFQELNDQYDAFRHAELVITDRLHGMVFSAITGTPCIVINSKSPKVRGCYDWIKELPYIRFCDDVNEIVSLYKTIPKQEWQYDNNKLIPLYEPLKQDIKQAVMRK
ncbi:MAG: polysaccharide pyruvyl transferase family protein [Parasporobacterium sp.]|nr:polysaccharide pyruvyl transferase family protein [Parasporobacterium sp.]